MVLIVYILVGESTWCSSLDQLMVEKLILCLIDLHVFKCISLWILYINIIFLLSCFAFSTIFYPTQCFTLSIVVCVYEGHRFGG